MPQQEMSFWRIIIADAIEQNLSRYKQNRRSEIDFVSDMAQRDSELNDPKNVTDTDLSSAWNFADSFFDAVTAGFADVDGIPIAEAEVLLSDTVQRLREHRSIEAPLILRYG